MSGSAIAVSQPPTPWVHQLPTMISTWGRSAEVQGRLGRNRKPRAFGFLGLNSGFRRDL
jgi:hypothetical protein